MQITHEDTCRREPTGSSLPPQPPCARGDPQLRVMAASQSWPASSPRPASWRNDAALALERFRAKWIPVRVKKTSQNTEIEPPFRFNRNGKGSRVMARGFGSALAVWAQPFQLHARVR